MKSECPWCGQNAGFSRHKVIFLAEDAEYHQVFKKIYGDFEILEGVTVTFCSNCDNFRLLVGKKVVYPTTILPAQSRFVDYAGNRIKISLSRMRHFIRRHPDVSTHLSKLPRLFRDPDVVVEVEKPVSGVHLYHLALPAGDNDENYLVAAVMAFRSSKDKRYVRTIYISDKIRDGVVVHRKGGL